MTRYAEWLYLSNAAIKSVLEKNELRGFGMLSLSPGLLTNFGGWEGAQWGSTMCMRNVCFVMRCSQGCNFCNTDSEIVSVSFYKYELIIHILIAVILHAA